MYILSYPRIPDLELRFGLNEVNLICTQDGYCIVFENILTLFKKTEFT